MNHTTERYLKQSESSVEKIKCPICMEDAHKIFSVGTRKDPQEKGYPYWEENFTHKPVLVTGPGHRKELMRKYGVREYRSPRWRGHPGAWV